MNYPLADVDGVVGAQGAGGGEYFRLLIGLFAFVAILFAAWLILKWLTRKNSLFGRGSHMKVLDRLYLGKDSYIALIELGGKILAVGVCKDRMSTLSSFSPAEFELERDIETEEASPLSFGLGRIFSRTGDKARGGGAPVAAKTAFSDLFKGLVSKDGETEEPAYAESQDDGLDSMYDALSKRAGKYIRKQR